MINDKNQIDKILKNAKKSMEIEGFEINTDLEEIGRKLLTGELGMFEYIEACKEKAREYSQ